MDHGGGELWEDGCFVRTVADGVGAEMIKRYHAYQRREKELSVLGCSSSPILWAASFTST